MLRTVVTPVLSFVLLGGGITVLSWDRWQPAPPTDVAEAPAPQVPASEETPGAAAPQDQAGPAAPARQETSGPDAAGPGEAAAPHTSPAARRPTAAPAEPIRRESEPGSPPGSPERLTALVPPEPEDGRPEDARAGAPDAGPAEARGAGDQGLALRAPRSDPPPPGASSRGDTAAGPVAVRQPDQAPEMAGPEPARVAAPAPAPAARQTPAPEAEALPQARAASGAGGEPGRALSEDTPARGTGTSGDARPGDERSPEGSVEAIPQAQPGPLPDPLSLETIRRRFAAFFGIEPTLDRDPPWGPKVAPEPAERTPETAPPTSLPKDLILPRFDIVRVEADGRALVAGRAAPGAVVDVFAGGERIDRVIADRRGQWVSLPVKPLAAGDQELTLRASLDGRPAADSEQVVVVAVPGGAGRDTVAAAPGPDAETREPVEPLAVLLRRDGGGRGEILQAPGRIGTDGELSLLQIDYDDEGRVKLAGEGPPGAPIRIYVDNERAVDAVVRPAGLWEARLSAAIEPGDYTLRLDQLDAKGEPVSRLETPFTRVAKPPREGQVQVDLVVVQPGNSLWRIARRLYGDGFRYVEIYRNNEAQIRNPDLIYPGQVFEIPGETGES